jgi:type I restriction enzyme S subunit
MEVREGYKKTEVGVIPGDWEVKPLEYLCKPSGLVRGPFGGALKKEYFVKSGYKVYEQRNAIYKNPNIGNYYINKDKFDELARFAVKQGDFIISCSGTIGKIFQIPKNYKQGVINQALLKLTIDSSKAVDKFFEVYFSWDRFQDKIIDSTQGGAMKNLVGMDVFKKTLVAIPPIPEQQAIAAALSDVDAVISSLTKLISKKKNIKQGAMQELLTGKKKLEGFINEIKYTSLSSLCNTFCDGDWIESKDQSDEGYRLVQTGNIGVGRFLDKSDKKRYISRETFDRLSCTEVFYDDVLVSRLPEPAGRACLVPELKEPMITAVDCTILRFTNYNPVLFVNYSQTFEYQKQISTMLGGSTRQRISRKELGKVLVPFFPSDKEQTAIANILSDIDAEIEVLEQKLNKYKAIKQGMMHELLNGRIRLI